MNFSPGIIFASSLDASWPWPCSLAIPSLHPARKPNRGWPDNSEQVGHDARHATRRSSDRLMHRYQLRSIGECRLHLDVMNHLGDAIHHLIARKHVSARLHQLGNGLAVARTFENEIGDQRHAFRMIELDAAVEAAARYHRSHGNQQLVLFTWGKMHATCSTRFNSPTGAAATSRAGHPSP